jgi:hypothetical protein
LDAPQSKQRQKCIHHTVIGLCNDTCCGSETVAQIRLVGWPLTKLSVLQLDEKNDRRGDEVRWLNGGKTTVPKSPRFWDARGNKSWLAWESYFTLALLKEAADVALWSRKERWR